MPQIFFDRAYGETLDLMVEARNYLTVVEPVERRRRAMEPSLRMSCEAMRVTTRLTQVMAWLMLQRAVESGEMTAAEASDERHRLSAAAVCLDTAANDDAELPPGLRSLMARSHRLYLRVSRLEGLMRTRLN